MRVNICLTLVALLLLCGTRAMALAPVGPPKNLLPYGKFGLGLDISHQSMDLTASGIYQETQTGGTFGKRPDLDIRDLESQSLFATLAIAVNDRVDVFVNLGLSNASDDIVVQSAPANSTQFFNAGNTFTFDAGHEFAWGAGTRFTLLQEENLTWGGTVRATWQNPDPATEYWTDPSDSTQQLDLNMELDFWEVVIAFGPTVELGQVSIYGGPMAYMLQGDLDMHGTWHDSTNNDEFNANYDLDDEFAVGGFFGAQTKVADNLSWYIDGQITGDAWGVGIGGLWRVE